MPRKHLVVLLVLLVTGCAAQEPVPPTPRAPRKPPATATSPATRPVTVRGVVDARTLEFANGVRARVSLLAPPSACWAADSLAFAKATLLNKPVRLARIAPGEITVELEDGTDYAVLAVRQGALRAQGAAGVLAAAETAAAKEKRGLWGPPCLGQSAAPDVEAAGLLRDETAFDGVRR